MRMFLRRFNSVEKLVIHNPHNLTPLNSSQNCSYFRYTSKQLAYGYFVIQ
jgi:hypothetical protein